MAKQRHTTEMTLLDEYMKAFKEEGFPFTEFGRLSESKDVLFDLPFAEEGHMIVHMSEVNEDTVEGVLYDIIPYRFVDDATKQQILNIVNSKLGEDTLHYHERVKRFCVIIELKRGFIKEDKGLGDGLRSVLCELGETIISCLQ